MSRKRWTIAFSPAGEGNYRLEIRRSGAVHRFETKLPPDISDLWEEPSEKTGTTRTFRSSNAATLSPEERFFQAADLPTLKDIGERVLDCLFDLKNSAEGPKIIGALEDRIADAEGVELEFDLSQTAELSSIPWESLYLRSRDRFLAIGTSSNIVRKLDAQAELPPPIERPIRILVVAANPREDLDTDVELGNIQRRIDEMVAEGDSDFQVVAMPDAKRDEFRRKVNEWRPHIIHYIGHSSFDGSEGCLYFESEEEGKSDRVSAEVLRNMLLNRRPWLVVLNSCQSGATSRDAPMNGMAQNLLQRLNIPFVVAMQQPVSDDAAINFSQDFYTALTSGETVASAVTMGRCGIANDADVLTQCELITPVLYTSGDAERLQFAERAEPVVAAATAAAPAGHEEKESFLASLDSSTKKVASIIGSVTAIGAAAFGVWQWMAPDPQPVPAPQVAANGQVLPAPLPTKQPDSDRDGVVDDAQVAPDVQPEATVVPAPPPRRPAQPNPQVAVGQPIAQPVTPAENQPVPRRAVRSAPLDPDSQPDTQQAYSIMPDEPYTAAYQPAPPPPPYIAGGIFERPGAPAPVTELGGGEGLGEPWASEFLPTPENPQVYLSMLDEQRLPVFCEGLALTVNFDLGATVPIMQDQQRLQNYAQELACPRSKLVVAGFTDTTGSEMLNMAVSLERAMNVIGEMEPYGEMFVTRDANAYSEDYPVVPTADEVEEPANRRAEVYLDFYCPDDFEIADTLLPGESYVPGQEARAYPGSPEQPRPVVVALQMRDAAEMPGGEDLAWLQATANAVGADIGAPPGMVFPMIVSGSCLADDQDTRIDIIY
ncbi:CHAT domain-containing protein [Aurantiacibacter hainanensis]|uniref:CHAT domain-containing protein n=1 Tax=Aurantiacibacter hainanensis TaxID=3076114 RepID=UPI0030C66119